MQRRFRFSRYLLLEYGNGEGFFDDRVFEVLGEVFCRQKLGSKVVEVLD